MRVVFNLTGPDGTIVGEDALLADPVLAAALTRDLGASEGGLQIEDPDSGTRASLGDTLPVLMEGFCVEGLETLRRDGHIEVDFYDHVETLKIAVADGMVLFDSTRFGKRAFPGDAYFAAMRACGERYAAFLTSLPEQDIEVVDHTDSGWGEPVGPADPVAAPATPN